ncbi:MAG: hypothetical protein LBU38_04850 [Propionibacteriaceae bacterium]|jgi:hypothetical protein|nr:hypothetical protein [Propionibacteriaceae bacterium]
MSILDDEVLEWQWELAMLCLEVIKPEGAQKPLVDADEVCFLGVFGDFPKGLSYLEGGVFRVPPEIYYVGMEKGDLIAADKWQEKIGQARWEQAFTDFSRKMGELEAIYAKHGRKRAKAIRNVIVLANGDAMTTYDFDLDPSPHPSMTAADAFFDYWMMESVNCGSAYKVLLDE